jgi:hypothetical protein
MYISKFCKQISLTMLSLSISVLLISIASAEETTPPASGNTTAGVFDGAGNAINGNANGSNVSNNQNNVQTGSNTNTNANQTQVIAPAQAVGGSSALVLPRNPLMLGNAGLGRSNFGLQFGLNNNPVLSNVFSNSKGSGHAMSWFMQGGVTIPFGKIPDIIANPRNTAMDDQRLQRLDDDRQVFGAMAAPQTSVQGRVVSLNAYNYSTAASPKVTNMQDALKEIEAKAAEASTPKVVALADAPVFSKPLNKGQKIGTTTVGDEYRYVGHTSSGWVKLVLADGRQGWSKGQFEYLKNDYTEIDNVTAHNSLDDIRESLDGKQSKKLVSLNRK